MTNNRQVNDITEYLRQVSDINLAWSYSTLVFRGQENEEWRLDSSAARRLRESLPSQEEITDPLFLEYNEDLIKKCRLKNYDQRKEKQLDDLELLADLQHHGAATCLTDFTHSSLVALWFACKKSNANGKVFVVNTADEKFFLRMTHTDIDNKSINDILKFQTRVTDQNQTTALLTEETGAALLNRLGFWYWTPAHLNERITAQHSLFLFGLPSFGEPKSTKIIIESASKEKILKELKELHDISEETLFPGFVGFAYTQRSESPYPIRNSETYFLNSGIQAQQQGQTSEAIQDFSKAIKLGSDNPDIYHLRGRAYIDRAEYDHAIQDLTNAIRLNI